METQQQLQPPTTSVCLSLLPMCPLAFDLQFRLQLSVRLSVCAALYTPSMQTSKVGIVKPVDK